MSIWRCTVSYRCGEIWMRRDVDVLAGDGADVLAALTRFFGSDNYRLLGFVRLADHPRVLVGVAS